MKALTKKNFLHSQVLFLLLPVSDGSQSFQHSLQDRVKHFTHNLKSWLGSKLYQEKVMLAKSGESLRSDLKRVGLWAWYSSFCTVRGVKQHWEWLTFWYSSRMNWRIFDCILLLRKLFAILLSNALLYYNQLASHNTLVYLLTIL